MNGALYNWFTVNNSNLCPTGWHVPSNTEWLTLIDFLGGYAIYWSSDESSLIQAINRVLVFDNTNFRIGYDNKTAGFSVRCIKDY